MPGFRVGPRWSLAAGGERKHEAENEEKKAVAHVYRCSAKAKNK
jgi:hypothetical protein